MTGVDENSQSESGGSRQVSPQQQLQSGNASESEASVPNGVNSINGSPTSGTAQTSGGAMFSITSDDSLSVHVGKPSPSQLDQPGANSRPHRPKHQHHHHHRINLQRSRSASEVAQLDANAAKDIQSPTTVDSNNDCWPPASSASRSGKPTPPLHIGILGPTSNSRDTIPGHYGEAGANGDSTLDDKKTGLRYSKTIPSSIAKAKGRRGTTVHDHPGSTISALALSIHKGKQQSKLRRRLIFKNGDSNISATNVHKMSQRYLADIFTTLVDMQWRWTILLFSSSFFVSWVFFAAIWWLLAYLHDDLVDGPPHGNISGVKPCVQYVNSFPTALLFSIETQHTIGYGFRHTTDECPHAIGLMMVQSVFSVLLQAFMAGIVFAKLSRPLKRAETLMFSKHAVICERDGKLCLLIRIGDMRKSHILDGTIRALMVKKRETREGETLPLYQHNVDLKMECGDQQLYLFWPLIACHVIDDNSPLFNISYKSLKDERFELIVILEGVVESTGMSTQAKTSYLPAEIKWGHRFTPLITYQKEDGTYQIDYRLFDETYDVETPMCSARELMEKRSEGRMIPMIKPSGFQGETPGMYSNGGNGTAMTPVQPQNDTFKPPFFGHQSSEMWPAGPRSTIMDQSPKVGSSSWLNWLRKRKRPDNDVVDGMRFSAGDGPGESLPLAAPPFGFRGRGDVERGAEDNRKLLVGDDKLAHDV